ncbi:hypothetical protein [Spiroplasma sp. AdecLV25b]|uniref:hypothetical protein n=1 Tax=Spiroplasma sp. AdecLV25b TaxID=3027162 RepID=UPI0027DFE471|nr:hypothetical protein [Spiroplasma sp. AdecLV25b]
MIGVISKVAEKLLREIPPEISGFYKKIVDIVSEKELGIATLNQQSEELVLKIEKATKYKTKILNELLSKINQLKEQLEIKKDEEIKELNKKIKKTKKETEIIALKQQITEIETEIVPKIAGFYQQMTDLESEILEINQQLEESLKTEKIEAIATLNKQITKIIKNLGNKKISINQQSKELVTKILEINQELGKLALKWEKKTEQLNKLETEKVSEIAAEINQQLNKEIGKIITVEIEAITAKIDVLKQKLPEKASEILEIKQQVKELKTKKSEELVTKIIEINQQLEKLEVNKNFAKIKFNKKIKELKTKKIEAIATLNQQSPEVEQLNKLEAEIASEIASEKKTFTEQVSTLDNEIRFGIEKLNKEIDKIVTVEIEAITAKIDALKQKLPEKASEILEIKHQISNITFEKEFKIKNKVLEIKAKVEKIVCKWTENTEKLNEQKTKITSNKEELYEQLEKLEVKETEEIAKFYQQITEVTKLNEQKSNIVAEEKCKAEEISAKIDALKQKLPEKASEIAEFYQKFKELKTIKVKKIEKLNEEITKKTNEVVPKIAGFYQQMTDIISEKTSKKLNEVEGFKIIIKDKRNASIGDCLTRIKEELENSEVFSNSNINSAEFDSAGNSNNKHFTWIGKTANGFKKNVTAFFQAITDKVTECVDNLTLDQCNSKKNDIENEIKKLEVKKLGKGWNNFWKNLSCGIFDRNARLDRKIEKRQKELSEVEKKMNEINTKSQSFEEEQPSTSANLRSRLVGECNAEAQVHMPLESSIQFPNYSLNC